MINIASMSITYNVCVMLYIEIKSERNGWQSCQR